MHILTVRLKLPDMWQSIQSLFINIIMINRCAGVNDCEATDTGASVDNCARHYHCSFAQVYVARDDGARMYEYCQFSARGKYRFSQTPLSVGSNSSVGPSTGRKDDAGRSEY